MGWRDAAGSETLLALQPVVSLQDTHANQCDGQRGEGWSMETDISPDSDITIVMKGFGLLLVFKVHIYNWKPLPLLPLFSSNDTVIYR